MNICFIFQAVVENEAEGDVDDNNAPVRFKYMIYMRAINFTIYWRPFKFLEFQSNSIENMRAILKYCQQFGFIFQAVVENEAEGNVDDNNAHVRFKYMIYMRAINFTIYWRPFKFLE